MKPAKAQLARFTGYQAGRMPLCQKGDVARWQAQCDPCPDACATRGFRLGRTLAWLGVDQAPRPTSSRKSTPTRPLAPPKGGSRVCKAGIRATWRRDLSWLRRGNARKTYKDHQCPGWRHLNCCVLSRKQAWNVWIRDKHSAQTSTKSAAGSADRCLRRSKGEGRGPRDALRNQCWPRSWPINRS